MTRAVEDAPKLPDNAKNIAVLKGLMRWTDATERAALTAAIAALNGREWQPIESCPNESLVVMFCDEKNNIWTDGAWDRSAACTGYYATHWMPLPQPPKEIE